MYIENQCEKCAGCASCANICPCGAITIKCNKNGFYVPVTDKAKCTKCGLCTRVCPQINNVIKNTDNPSVFAVMADNELRLKSSSGGAFSVIAKKIFEKNGVVVGAAFNDNWIVEHIIIDNEKDLDKLRGSKYVQSFISEHLFKDIKDILEQNRYVLFTGCPCQVAGLKAFLNKDYKNLILVDLICSKVPSKKVFDKFIDDNFSRSEIENIKFRDKQNGWNCSTIYTYTATTTTTKSPYWFKMFLNSLSMNDSCVECKYMSIDRVGDITIGDFWRVSKFAPELDDNLGTSIVIVNNKKGEDLFNDLLWQKKQLMTKEQAIYGNRALLVPFLPHNNRQLFASKISENQQSFNKIVKDCLSDKYNIGILNWWWNSNRGAILTCWAIQEAVKELGYNPSVIMHIPFDYYNSTYKGSISEKFANKYLNLTEWCHSRIDMRRLNDKFSTFMVGSDQVWNHELNWFLQDFYYLNFVQLNKNKISIAASFGKPVFTGNDTVKSMVSYYLRRFNSISVREYKSVEICKDVFGVDSELVLDPVFLIEKEKYEKIISDSTRKDKNYIAYYFINEDKQKIEIMNEISKKYNLPLIDIKAKNDVTDWLYLIKNSNFVVSDSFHATCFSLIFNKQFITFDKAKYKDARFETLIALTKLEKNFVRASDFDIDKVDYYKEIRDWDSTFEEINKKKQETITWLQGALGKDVSKIKYDKNQEFAEAFYASMDDRLNYVEAACRAKPQVNQDDNFKLLLNRKNILFKYFFYRIMTNFTFGKTKMKLKFKKIKYEEKFMKIKEIMTANNIKIKT